MKRLNMHGRNRNTAAKRLEPVAAALVMALGIGDELQLTGLPGLGPGAKGTSVELLARWLAAHGHDWPSEETLSQLPQRVAELLDLLESAETTTAAKEVSHAH